jgi:hypothetical protein
MSGDHLLNTSRVSIVDMERVVLRYYSLAVGF